MPPEDVPARSARSRGRRLGLLVGAVALLGVGALAWRAGWIGGSRPPRNVLIIAIDSQRTDRLGAYGSARGLTPFLDQLAARSVVYEQAYAPSSWTLPTVASLFVGKYPSEHGVTRFFTAVADVETTLAEVMAAHGFTTWGLTTNSAIDPDVGFGQGFDRYELLGEPTMMNPKADGGLINDRLFSWIDEDPAAKERKHFVYLHYMDVHAPYRPHFVLTESRADNVERGDIDLNLRVLTGSRVEGQAKQQETWNFSDAEVQRIVQMYEGEVRYQDGILKALFDGLAQRGFLDNTMVIITADHGEELGLHRTFYHGTSLFDPAIHVPLIIQDPQAEPGRIKTPVQLAGLGPLIFERSGIPRPASFRIDPVPRQEAPGDKALVYSELLESGQIHFWQHKQALTGSAEKLLVTSDDVFQTFDRAADPDELSPRIDVAGPLRTALDAIVAAIKDPAAPQAVELDEAAQERLRAVGYLDHDEK